MERIQLQNRGERSQFSFLRVFRKAREVARELTLVGNVPPEAWSPEDRARMAEGKRPKGHPSHPNV